MVGRLSGATVSPLLGGLGIALSLVIHQLWIIRYVFRNILFARSHGDSHMISSRVSNLNRPNHRRQRYWR